MADRKVLVKYYPPDFDPEKLAQKGRLYRNYEAKRRRGAVKLMNVRFMFPFTMCCGMCNEFIYIGTKFNSRVEKIKGEEYLGIPIWRFYARCPHCRSEITFKTDPQNTEYVLESGGVRTYDPRKDADLAETALKEKLEEEMTDSMRALEHKTHSTANELMMLEQLDELRKINKRLLNRESTLDHALEWLKKGGLHSDTAQEDLAKDADDGFDEADLRELMTAKEEMDTLRLEKSLGVQSPTTGPSDDEAKSAKENSDQESSVLDLSPTPLKKPRSQIKDTSNLLNTEEFQTELQAQALPSTFKRPPGGVKKHFPVEYLPLNVTKELTLNGLSTGAPSALAEWRQTTQLLIRKKPTTTSSPFTSSAVRGVQVQSIIQGYDDEEGSLKSD